MSRNLNRKKFFFFNTKNSYYLIFSIIVIISIYFIFSQKKFLLINITNVVENFSKNYGYQYNNLSISGLNRVKYTFIEKKLEKFSNSSIFLLPFDKISVEIKENNWVKSIKLKTNYKDTLFIDLKEYIPIGLYNFNNKLFYFDANGKIIGRFDETLNTNEKLLIFFGKSSNLKANSIINIIKKIDFEKKYKIKSIEYIEKRRWDIYLKNNIKLMLSETKPKISLQNFMNIEKNLSETDLNNIKYFDLRNINKTLINYN